MDTLARTLQRSSRCKENIAFFSLKTNSMQYCESRFEARHALSKEFKKPIGKYVTQPTSIFYIRNGKEYRYTPDSLVKEISGKFYFEELKPFKLTLTQQFQDKFSFLQEHFANVIGHPLVINTSLSDSYTNKKIENYEQLYISRKQVPAEEHVLELLNELGTETCIRQMSEKAKYLKLPTTLPWQLVAHDHYTYNNENLLHADSMLELQQHEK